MTKKNKLLLLAAVCLLIVISICVVSCSGGGKEEAVQSHSPAATAAKNTGSEKLSYTLLLKSEGGMPLEGVGVYFYTDSTLAELVWFAKTDAEGKVGFEDLASDSYVAVLDKVPDGYKVEEYYPLTGETTEIILSADMAEGDLADLRYKLGDVMMNFSVTGSDGTVYVLSELLQQKQAVVLNFWYLECAPCRAEFPYLQEAYAKYSDKLEVLALNPVNEDSTAIDAFREEQGLTFPMMHCDPAWAEAMELTAYPTTVVIDRYGNIALIHKGSIDKAKTFEDAFAFFTAEDYVQTQVKDILDLEIKAAGSDSENPIEVGGKTSFQLTVGPGQLVYYHLYRLDGMYLTINSNSIYAIFNDRTYRPSGGSLNFTVTCPDTFTPAAITFGNSGTTEVTVTATLSAPAGTYNNPHTLKLGDFTTRTAAGNDQGVFYMYTATEDGLLTVKCNSVSPKNVKYDYTLTNENTMAVRTIKEDGDSDAGTVSISVKKGHKVRLTIGSLPDDSNSYPAATFTSTASIGEDTGTDDAQVKKIDYAVTVTDPDRKPISGVFMKMTAVPVETEETDETKKTQQKATTTVTSVTISTNEEGVAVTNQSAGTYDVVLTLPAGYTASTTKFKLTEANPFVSLKLEELIEETGTYTWTISSDGMPVANALVTVGSQFAYTDADGKVTFTLPVGEHTLFITVEGESYSCPVTVEKTENTEKAEESVDLDQFQTDEGGGDSDGAPEYVITVLDYSDKPQSDVVVQILKDGVPAATGQTDAAGAVTATLEPAEYTVSLAFSNSSLHYEPKTAVLHEGETDLTIRVAKKVKGTPEELYVGNAYYLDVGGTYVTMQPDAVNYYIFEPKDPGLYRISTSDPDAIVSYWGGSPFYIADMTSSTDYNAATNSFTRNVKKNNIGGIVILGITGDEDCIVEITRIGDPILDETDIVADIYEGKTTPKKPYKISAANGKKLKYVDLTADSIKIVLGSDGYYHLNTANGPLLYMRLGTATVDAPYVTMYKLVGASGVGGTSFAAVFRDENGSAVSKEDYTECMLAYVKNADPTYGVYPLTEDLVYMMQNGGNQKGWWNPDSANCLFVDEDGNLDTSINLDIAWMFAVCYVP